jgi:cobalamin biosynthesis protein CobD/CbiB
VNLFGAAAIGVFPRLKNFFNFSGPIPFFIGLIELISEFARMISFSFRLFGNIFAGEVLLTIVGFLAPYIVPFPFLFLEVFVGFVQALIFSMLSIVFIAIATMDHHATERAPATKKHQLPGLVPRRLEAKFLPFARYAGLRTRPRSRSAPADSQPSEPIGLELLEPSH